MSAYILLVYLAMYLAALIVVSLLVSRRLRAERRVNPRMRRDG